MKKVKIRQEKADDHQAIGEVVRAAFENHPHSNQTEHVLVAKLRETEALSLSLVAEREGEIVGHIAFSPVTVDGTPTKWYGLAPVSVRPDFQRRGIGGILIRTGLTELQGRGAKGCVLLGEPAYYGRFGFVNRQGLTLPGVPPEYFLALPLLGEVAQGEVAYHETFAVCG